MGLVLVNIKKTRWDVVHSFNENDILWVILHKYANEEIEISDFLTEDYRYGDVYVVQEKELFEIESIGIGLLQLKCKKRNESAT